MEVRREGFGVLCLRRAPLRLAVRECGAEISAGKGAVHNVGEAPNSAGLPLADAEGRLHAVVQVRGHSCWYNVSFVYLTTGLATAQSRRSESDARATSQRPPFPATWRSSPSCPSAPRRQATGPLPHIRTHRQHGLLTSLLPAAEWQRNARRTLVREHRHLHHPAHDASAHRREYAEREYEKEAPDDALGEGVFLLLRYELL